jgi:hypothetical protein
MPTHYQIFNIQLNIKDKDGGQESSEYILKALELSQIISQKSTTAAKTSGTIPSIALPVSFSVVQMIPYITDISPRDY